MSNSNFYRALHRHGNMSRWAIASMTRLPYDPVRDDPLLPAKMSLALFEMSSSGIRSMVKWSLTKMGIIKAAKGGLKPLGLGSTGRTTANNLAEQMGMKDSRWSGWTKMEYKVKTENGVLKAVDNFKFK